MDYAELQQSGSPGLEIVIGKVAYGVGIPYCVVYTERSHPATSGQIDACTMHTYTDTDRREASATIM